MGRCRTAVHNGHRYVSTTSKAKGCFLMRTSDLCHWEQLPAPAHAVRCHGMASHHGHFIFLFEPDIDHDPEKHPDLFRMNCATHESEEEDQPTSSGIAWERLPNRQARALRGNDCPTDKLGHCVGTTAQPTSSGIAWERLPNDRATVTNRDVQTSFYRG